MKHSIVKVGSENYSMFDDMVYWRMNGKERIPSKEVVVQSILKELDNPNLFIYAVETVGKFVGWISLIYMPKVGKYNGHGHVYIDELWIEPNYRRNGYAKELMMQADALVEEKDASGIRLYVNIENQNAYELYQRCGFIHSCSAYLMEK